MTEEQIREGMAEFYNFWSNSVPGKYWKMTPAHKHKLPQYLISEKYLPMIKYDGYWARAIIGETGVLIQSRGISKVTGTYGDYTALVPHIVDELKTLFPPGTVVVGEMCYDKDLTKKATDVGKILRCKAPTAIARQKDDSKKLSFRVFDMLAYSYENIHEKPFLDRFSQLAQATMNDYFGETNHWNNAWVNTAEWRMAGHGEDLLKEVWDAGGEGIILLNTELPYKIGGAQAWHSIKVKRALGELEAQVVGTLEPTRIYEGRTDLDEWPYWEGDTPVTKPYFNGWKVGVVVEYKGRTIKITSGTTDDDAEYLAGSAAKELIENGQLWAVFTGMELTKDSVRHPNLIRLRDDM